MRAKDVIIGEHYRHKEFPDGWWAKVIGILKPYEGKNVSGRIIANVHWASNKDANVGIVKYFAVSDLIKPVLKEQTNV